MQNNYYLIILNWINRSKQNLDHLKNILHFSTEQIILLTNESDKYIEHFSYVKHLTNNLGYARANNFGIRRAMGEGAEYVFIINPDVEINRDTIPNLLKVFKKYPDTGIAGPKIYTPDKKIWGAGGIIDPVRYSGGLRGLGEQDKGQYDRVEDADFISGTAMMVKREVFEKIGFLPEDYFLYYEDADFCMKARKAGFQLKYVPESTIIHYESSNTGKNSPLQRYYMARNRLIFMRKYASLSVLIRELIRTPKTIYENIKNRDKYSLLGIRDFLLGRKGKCDYWS